MLVFVLMSQRRSLFFREVRLHGRSTGPGEQQICCLGTIKLRLTAMLKYIVGDGGKDGAI